MEESKTRAVRIEVLDGVFKYTPLKCHARRGENIVWICDDGPFAVQFFAISPLETAYAQSGDTNGQVGSRVLPEALTGTYEYACAVFVNGRVCLDASCPSIIIDWP